MEMKFKEKYEMLLKIYKNQFGNVNEHFFSKVLYALRCKNRKEIEQRYLEFETENFVLFHSISNFLKIYYKFYDLDICWRDQRIINEYKCLNRKNNYEECEDKHILKKLFKGLVIDKFSYGRDQIINYEKLKTFNLQNEPINLTKNNLQRVCESSYKSAFSGLLSRRGQYLVEFKNKSNRIVKISNHARRMFFMRLVSFCLYFGFDLVEKTFPQIKSWCHDVFHKRIDYKSVEYDKYILQGLRLAKKFTFKNISRKRDKKHFSKRENQDTLRFVCFPICFIFNTKDSILLTCELYSGNHDCRPVNKFFKSKNFYIQLEDFCKNKY